MTAQPLKASRTRWGSYWEERLAALGRQDRRHWGQVYGRGLLLEGERQSAGARAERLPDGNQQSLQPFVSQSRWAWDPLWRQMAERMEGAFSPPSLGLWRIRDSPKRANTRSGSPARMRARWAKAPTAKWP